MAKIIMPSEEPVRAVFNRQPAGNYKFPMLICLDPYNPPTSFNNREEGTASFPLVVIKRPEDLPKNSSYVILIEDVRIIEAGDSLP